MTCMIVGLGVLMTDSKKFISEKSITGVPGLDEVLGGGLPKNQLFLLQGKPGTGKTTLSLQYLMEGRLPAL